MTEPLVPLRASGPDLDAFPAAAVLLAGPAFVVDAANDEAAALFGRNDLVGARLSTLLDPSDEQRVAQALRHVVASGDACKVREVHLGARGFADFAFRATTDGVLAVAVDVSERVSTRHRFELEQARLEAVFQNVSAALAILRGPQAVYEKTNESYERLFTDRPLVGKPLLEALPELRGQKFPELISRVYATGEPYSETEARAFLRRTGDGALEERFFDQSYTQVPDAQGRPYGVLVHAIDVTERVRSREKLDAEAEKNARLLQFMPTAFFSVTPEWILNYMNPAAEEVLGLRAADVVGRSLWDVWPGLVGSKFGEAYARAMNEGVRLVTQAYYPDYDRWYEAWSYPLDRGLAVSFFDITERKQDELRRRAEQERLQAIFNGSAAAMVFFRGPELKYEMVNAQYRSLVPDRELLGKPLAEALPELTGTAFPTLIKRVFDTGVPVVTHEELAPILNKATGVVEDRFFDSGISRITDGAGNPYGVFVQATEVTERVLTRRRLEEALAARDTFLSIASHELRTPLTGMKLHAQLIRRSLDKGDLTALAPERIRKLAEQLDSGLGRMARLVEDMLDISRIENGKLSLDREPANLTELVRDVLGRFSAELAGAGIEVTLRAPEQPLTVSADRFRLEQVVTNLVTNAIRYAPRAPVQIELSAAEERVQLVFHDGGAGIQAENRERVFERFERLVAANHVGGMGLGLYIVRQIIEAHAGRIFVAEAVRGARFVIELPRLQAAPA